MGAVRRAVRARAAGGAFYPLTRRGAKNAIVRAAARRAGAPDSSRDGVLPMASAR
jgi:hypothetical protein